PPFGADAVHCTQACAQPNDDDPATQNVGLLSNTYASYVGLRMSDFRATKHHAWKVGIDVNRENLLANQAFGCYYPDCAATGTHDQPFYLVSTPEQAQAGSQIGAYVQDKWQLSQNVELNYGLRYDHSTGYTSGFQWSPRIGLNVWDGGKNTAHVYYGKFYAAPLLEDVRQDCVVLQGCNGTPVYNLKPESDSYFEIGLVHKFSDRLSGSANVFRKSSVNILDTTQLLDTPLFAVFNNSIGLDTGVEFRLNDRAPNGNEWFFTGTVSGSYAACVSGSTFLFPPDTNPPNQSCVSQLSPEDHDETVVSTAGYTWRFGGGKQWFATLQGNYGSGFPVEFESSNTVLSGRLPAHTTFDFATGRSLSPGRTTDRELGVSVIVQNLLNHQYPIKVANGFNTTQIANGTNILVRLSEPF
ncbi:MAG TPA: TonB-dependent receptor, partial [Candidatus Tumulicola sp.]